MQSTLSLTSLIPQHAVSLKTCNGDWINWRTDTSPVLNLNGWNSEVTIMIKNVDLWIANTVGLQVGYLQILDSNDNVIRQYDFSSKVCMGVTSGYYGYGQLRNPTSMLYGTRNYPASYHPPAWELETSQGVSGAIHDFFYNTGKYSYLADSWGDNTEPSIVYSTTDTTERYYDYSTVFYKRNVWSFGGPCDEPGCTLLHVGLQNDDGTQIIKDYKIDNEVIEVMATNSKSAGTHDFIFMWACGLSNSTYAAEFHEDHSSGIMACWMHLDPLSLNTDAYNGDGYHPNPDYSDHVFLCFEWLSIYYRAPATDPTYNYGHWAYYFYDYLLNHGYTVRAALDKASELTHDGDNFGDCPLDNGYLAYNPLTRNDEQSKMRIYGDMSVRLPR